MKPIDSLRKARSDGHKEKMRAALAQQREGTGMVKEVRWLNDIDEIVLVERFFGDDVDEEYKRKKEEADVAKS